MVSLDVEDRREKKKKKKGTWASSVTDKGRGNETAP